MPKRYYKIQLSDETIKKLDSAALKYNLRTGNIIASEVIESYLDFWEEAEIERGKIIQRQLARARKSKRGKPTAEPETSKAIKKGSKK